jgi:hypothetical protein
MITISRKGWESCRSLTALQSNKLPRKSKKRKKQRGIIITNKARLKDHRWMLIRLLIWWTTDPAKINTKKSLINCWQLNFLLSLLPQSSQESRKFHFIKETTVRCLLSEVWRHFQSQKATGQRTLALPTPLWRRLRNDNWKLVRT